MKKKHFYTIATAPTTYKLSEVVQGYLDTGYEPIGAAIPNPKYDGYMQTLLKTIDA